MICSHKYTPTSTLVLVLCGKPGSGKSLISQCISNNVSRLEKALSDVSASKASQQQFTVSVDTVSFDDILESSISSQEFSPELWHQSRSAAFQRIQDLLVDSCNAPDSIEIPSNTIKLRLIIVDDNMQYRSMRFTIAKMTQKYGHQFVQLYVNTPIDLCLSRNSRRTGNSRVNEETIRSMEIEEPGTSGKWWDTNVIHFKNLDEYSKMENDSVLPYSVHECSIVENIPHQSLNGQNLEEFISVQLPWKQLAQFWHSSPIQAPLVQNSTKEFDSLQNQKNLIHQVDVRCRKIISSVLRGLDSTVSSNQLSNLLSSSKKQFLEMIRKNQCSTSSKEVEIEVGSFDDLIQFWESEFRSQVDFLTARISKDHNN